MITRRASRAVSAAVAGAVIAVGLGSSPATRIGGVIAALLIAGVTWSVGNDAPPAREAGDADDTDAQERELMAQETMRDIMRRRTAKLCAVAGLMFLTLIVVGYGPWSS